MTRVIIEETLCIEQKMTKNEEKYKAMIFGLELAHKLGGQHLRVYLDLELVSEQVNGNFETKEPQMKELCRRVQELMTKFKKIEVRTI